MNFVIISQTVALCAILVHSDVQNHLSNKIFNILSSFVSRSIVLAVVDCCMEYYKYLIGQAIWLNAIIILQHIA